MVDKNKVQKKQEKVRKIEKLENRIIINYAVAAVAYMTLNTLYKPPFHMNFKYVLPVAGIMLIAAIVCYLLHKKFKKTASYGHMFVAFALALSFTNLSTIIYKVLGQNVFNGLYSISLFQMLMNARNAVIIVSVLGAIYLVGMTIYNGILIYRENNPKKKEK